MKKHNHQIRLLLTQEEMERVKLEADRDALSLNAYLRQVLRQQWQRVDMDRERRERIEAQRAREYQVYLVNDDQPPSGEEGGG